MLWLGCKGTCMKQIYDIKEKRYNIKFLNCTSVPHLILTEMNFPDWSQLQLRQCHEINYFKKYLLFKILSITFMPIIEFKI